MTDFPWYYILLVPAGIVGVIWLFYQKRKERRQQEAAHLALNTPLTGDVYGAQQAAPYSPSPADGVASPYGVGGNGQPLQQQHGNNFAHSGDMYQQTGAAGSHQPYAAYPPPHQQQYHHYPPPPQHNQHQIPPGNLYQQSSGAGGDFGGNIYGAPDQFHAQQQPSSL